MQQPARSGTGRQGRGGRRKRPSASREADPELESKALRRLLHAQFRQEWRQAVGLFRGLPRPWRQVPVLTVTRVGGGHPGQSAARKVLGAGSGGAPRRAGVSSREKREEAAEPDPGPQKAGSLGAGLDFDDFERLLRPGCGLRQCRREGRSLEDRGPKGGSAPWSAPGCLTARPAGLAREAPWRKDPAGEARHPNTRSSAPRKGSRELQTPLLTPA